MAERAYLEVVWNHVLRDGELRAVTTRKGAVVLEVVAPTFRARFGSDALHIELRTKAPLDCAPLDAGSVNLPLARLHETHALAVSAPIVDEPRTLLLRAAPRRASGEPWLMASRG